MNHKRKRPRERVSSVGDHSSTVLSAPVASTLFDKSIALNDIEWKRIEKTVGAFVEKHRPAPHIRPKHDFGFRLSGQSLELFEIRPQWDRPAIKRESSR